MMEEYEDALLAIEAEKRLNQKVKYTSHESLMKKLGLGLTPKFGQNLN